MQIISRQEARRQGLKFYFTGKPCRRGHDSQRLVCSGTCYQCELIRNRSYHAKHRDRHIARMTAYNHSNRDKINDSMMAKYYADPGLWNAKSSVRRGLLKRATPEWYGEFDQLVMSEAFDAARLRQAETGIEKEMRDRLQHHAMRDVGSMHYDRYDYLPEKRAAMKLWSVWLDMVLAAKRGKVANLRTIAQ